MWVQQGAGSLALFPGDDDMLGGSPVATVRGTPRGGWAQMRMGEDGCTSDVVCNLSTWPILSLFLRVVHEMLPREPVHHARAHDLCFGAYQGNVFYMQERVLYSSDLPR